MSERRCRICLGIIEDGDAGNYHKACCRELFNASEAPELPYSWDELNRLAEKVVREHVSVPGVQPKLSLHLENTGYGAGRLTLIGMEGAYVLKPPVKQYHAMPELEHLTMRLARACGIECCTCGLIELEDKQWAFITRRMDRVAGHKRHMEDMCQLTDRLTERKYSGSMEQVGAMVLKYCDNAVFDALRLFEITVFCFLTGNADMHLKNFSLLYDDNGGIRLSPAYDLLPTALLLPEDKEETALTLSGKKRRIAIEDFFSFGKKIRLNDKQMENALKRLAQGFHDASLLIRHAFCDEETRNRYKDLVRERARRLHMAEMLLV